MSTFEDRLGKKFEALQWHKAGADAPVDVQSFRSDDVVGETPCAICGVMMYYHGVTHSSQETVIICPGDWLAVSAEGDIQSIKPEVFSREFQAT